MFLVHLPRLLTRSEAKFIKKVVKEVEKVLSTIQSGEGREDDCVKKVKTYNVPLALPWPWFGSVVGLIGAMLGLLTETVQKFASPAMFVLTGQAGSLVAILNRFADKSV
ncbi:unnamed protein product [Arabidopsis arenosa]|uniref:Uncharacterized protein n=1 Tax=Arabidopsis arenosa TaxID=38785 RepID=A0A8S1ZM79_ARAAE|nr:unnamed protein product [Arabidopsis arenosa]